MALKVPEKSSKLIAALHPKAGFGSTEQSYRSGNFYQPVTQASFFGFLNPFATQQSFYSNNGYGNGNYNGGYNQDYYPGNNIPGNNNQGNNYQGNYGGNYPQDGYNQGGNNYYTTPGFPFNLFPTTPITTTTPRPFPFNLFPAPTTQPPLPFPLNFLFPTTTPGPFLGIFG